MSLKSCHVSLLLDLLRFYTAYLHRVVRCCPMCPYWFKSGHSSFLMPLQDQAGLGLGLGFRVQSDTPRMRTPQRSQVERCERKGPARRPCRTGRSPLSERAPPGGRREPLGRASGGRRTAAVVSARPGRPWNCRGRSALESLPLLVRAPPRGEVVSRALSLVSLCSHLRDSIDLLAPLHAHA